MQNNNTFKLAFTLAEVLLTLIIIGVITAMTLPGLKKYAEMEENISLLKKSYATIANATKIIETKHGDMKRWGKFTSDKGEGEGEGEGEEGGGDEGNTETPDGLASLAKYYKESMSIMKDCTNGEEGCWTQTKDLKNSNYGSEKNIVANGIAFSSADGMNWSFSGIEDPSSLGVDKGNTASILIWVDTNGNKKPNILGYDVFAFIAHPEKGVLPAGIDNDSSDCKDGGKGTDCTARVLKENKINY